LQGLQRQQGLQLYNSQTVTAEKDTCMDSSDKRDSRLKQNLPAESATDSDSRDRYLQGHQLYNRNSMLKLEGRQCQQKKTPPGTPATTKTPGLQQKLHEEIAGKTVPAEKDTCRDSSDNGDSSFTAETPCRDCWETV
jgi:hypothetical protein